MDINNDAAWKDEDDDSVKVDLMAENRSRKLRQYERESVVTGTEYSNRLRNQFGLLNAKPKWASVQEDRDATVSSTIDPFSIVKSGAAGDIGPLLPDVISLRPMRNLNFHHPSKKPILSVSFHPFESWALVVSQDREICVFDVDGLDNKLLFSFKVTEMSVSCARFSQDGSKVVIVGKKECIFVWHIREKRMQKIPKIFGRKEKSWSLLEFSPCGRYLAIVGDLAAVIILSAKNFGVVGSFVMGSQVSSVVFSPNGKYLFAISRDSRIYLWDCETLDCIKMIHDESGTSGSAVTVTSDGQFLLAGSNLGVLNIYRMTDILDSALESRTLPIKSLMNLTTEISCICSHYKSELLAYSSRDKRNALRLVHLPSGRVFSNWPKEKTPLGHVRNVTFDPSGRHLALGNEKGQVLLYAIRHYCAG